jgi:hypothetical protein
MKRCSRRFTKSNPLQLAFGAEERARSDVLSFFIPVGVFLLMAARRPSEHRSMHCSSSLVEHLPCRGDGYSNRESLDSQRPQELY